MFIESNGREELVKCRGKKTSLPFRLGPGTTCGNTSEASARGGGVEQGAFPSLIGNSCGFWKEDGRDASRDKFITSR
jgi:hypothetical protein